MLYDYLINKYQPGEPIFLGDVKISGISDSTVRQYIKILCDSGKLIRYENGIYYLPKKSVIKGIIPLSPYQVAFSKYIEKNNNINGYLSGYSFANQLGITTQVPVTMDIVSNNTGTSVKKVFIKNQKIILRKPRVTVTKDNYLILQFLDLLKDIEKYSELPLAQCKEILKNYILKTKLTLKQLKEYIVFYPDKIYKSLFETELYNVFAQ